MNTSVFIYAALIAFSFVNTPSANQISLPTGVTCTAISTTAMTLTGTGTSGGGGVDGFQKPDNTTFKIQLQ